MPQESNNTSHLGLFHGGDGLLYWNACDVGPWLKSRLCSCSISWDLRSLKKSRREVSSTRVEDANEGCFGCSIPWQTK